MSKLIKAQDYSTRPNKVNTPQSQPRETAQESLSAQDPKTVNSPVLDPAALVMTESVVSHAADAVPQGNYLEVEESHKVKSLNKTVMFLFFLIAFLAISFALITYRMMDEVTKSREANQKIAQSVALLENRHKEFQQRIQLLLTQSAQEFAGLRAQTEDVSKTVQAQGNKLVDISSGQESLLSDIVENKQHLANRDLTMQELTTQQGDLAGRLKVLEKAANELQSRLSEIKSNPVLTDPAEVLRDADQLLNSPSQ